MLRWQRQHERYRTFLVSFCLSASYTSLPSLSHDSEKELVLGSAAQGNGVDKPVKQPTKQESLFSTKLDPISPFL